MSPIPTNVFRSKIEMSCVAGPDTILFRRNSRRPGDAAHQFDAAVAAIVEKAVAEDRARRPTAKSASKDGLETCPLCKGSKENPAFDPSCYDGEPYCCPRCKGVGTVPPEGPPTPPGKDGLETCPACDGGPGCDRCGRCGGSAVVMADGPQPPDEPPQPCSTCRGRSLRYKINGRDVTVPCPECGNQTDPAPTDRAQPCPACDGYGWVSMPDGQDNIRCPRCRPTPTTPPEPSTMPAFPMSKGVTFDYIILYREPREDGSAFAQFERALAGYLERHPVYRDRERVVERDRPCPICAAEADDDDDDDDWSEEDWGEDEERAEGGDDEMDDDDMDVVVAPASPPAAPGFPATLRQALAEETADPRDVREIAAALVRRMKVGDVDAIRFVEGGGGR